MMSGTTHTRLKLPSCRERHPNLVVAIQDGVRSVAGC